MFAQVAIPKLAIADGVLLYATAGLEISPGMLVQVPYKQEHIAGIVVELQEHSPYPNTKEVTQILSHTPVLTNTQLQIAKQIASYYFAPINRVLQQMFPKQLWEQQWTPKKETTYHLINESYTPAPQARKEARILESFQGRTTITTADLETAGLKPSDLKTLIQKQVLQKHTGALLPAFPYPGQCIPLSPLTAAQSTLYQQIRTLPACYLLHGITGSGKTHLYLHLVQDALSQGKQSIILVPEIGLTTQMIRSFQQHFGNHIAVLHSRLNDRERAQEWVRIEQKEAMIVIGSRSALFAPLQDYGMIIIDEEHDWSYKSDQTPKYHAVTVAQMLQQTHKCTLLLGSATPSIERYYHAQQGSYLLLELMEKYHQ